MPQCRPFFLLYYFLTIPGHILIIQPTNQLQIYLVLLFFNVLFSFLKTGFPNNTLTYQ